MKIGPPTEDDVPDLIQGLQGKDPRLRLAAAETLKLVGAEAYTAAPALREALRAEDKGLRAAVVDCLGNLDGGVRLEAARALSSIAKQARLAVPVLLKCLRDGEDANVRAGAAEVLGAIGPQALKVAPGVTAALLQARKDKNAEVRKEATEALKKVAPQALRPRGR
jgi:HEAT repeat protein